MKERNMSYKLKKTPGMMDETPAVLAETLRRCDGSNPVTTITFKQLPQTLRQLREERLLTQESAADMIGVCARSLSMWETGYRVPQLASLELIANGYGVEIKFVVDAMV